MWTARQEVDHVADDAAAKAAIKFGLNRTQLGLILNGADPMSKRIYEELRDFLRKA